VLSMLEEIVLLAIDEQTGNLRSCRECSTAYALVGAAFFDLALARRIDTDTDDVHVVDSSATGNGALDGILAEVAGRPDVRSVCDWIELIFLRRQDLEGEALHSLVSKGILRHERSKRLWVIDVERFPLAQGGQHRDVRARLAEAILGDAIPDTRDIMLAALAQQCGLLEFVLSNADLRRRRERIGRLCGVETVSRKVNQAIGNLDASMRRAAARVI
jgi:golgi phosphoprotein 3